MMIAILIMITRVLLVSAALIIVTDKLLGYYCRKRKKGICKRIMGKDGKTPEIMNTQVRDIRTLGDFLIMTFYRPKDGREWQSIYRKMA